MRSFASFHPFILLFYYITVITITMFMMHPLVLIFSLVGSLLFFASLNSLRTFLRDIRFYLLVFFLIAVTNPIFVHKGESILFYLNDNPVTLEAIIYGFIIATMLVAIIFWSKSYSGLMTTDKFVYLFGKAIPKLSLIISMALRFIPMFKNQMQKVNQTQKTLGLYTSNSITDRVLSGIRTFNSMIMWSLENAVRQADAMKARGYGLKGRTNFSLFKWHKRDIFTMLFMFIIFGVVMYFNVKKLYAFSYYPVTSGIKFSETECIQFIVVFILMILPTLVELKENLKWKLLRSKI